MPFNSSTIINLSDIQDDDDIYDRIRVRQILKKKKKKKKQRIKDEDYEEVDSPPLLHEKVQQMESKIKNKNVHKVLQTKTAMPNPSSLVGLNSVERRTICTSILEIFDNYDFQRIATFDSELQIHKLRLFIYSVMYSQEDYFKVDDIESYMSAFGTLKDLCEKSREFRGKFTTVSINDNDSKEIEAIITNRTIEKVNLPPIILKRLNIQ